MDTVTTSARHHTVPRFLLADFGEERSTGLRICQLDITTGQPRQVSPRDAGVRTHFYSIDIDDGARSSVVEEALGMVESAAAPCIRGLANSAFPQNEQRAELALFMAMAKLRTPIWREHQKSLQEQFTLMWHSEKTRAMDVESMRAAFANTDWASRPDDELERMRRGMVADLDAGHYEIEVPVNELIRTFLQQSTILAWVLFALDWALVRTDGHAFVLGDTPVSVYDRTPKFPGSGAGPLSSENVETFVPLAPGYGVLARPNPRSLDALWTLVDKLPSMTLEERADALASQEGTWSVLEATDGLVDELNLRTYAHAQRFIFGSQEAVTASRSYARRNSRRRREVTPGPPRIHILEDDPGSPGVMRAAHVFEPR